MMQKQMLLIAACAVAGWGAMNASAQDYTFRVVARGLNKPTGIAVGGHFQNRLVYFTEVPTPGVPGNMGGMNAVKLLRLNFNFIETISMGEPEPVNLALTTNGHLYWTCKSAGVILLKPNGQSVLPLLTGLNQPHGIAVDPQRNIYFTQLPTPGVPGSMGGMNTVDFYNQNGLMNLTTGEPEPTDITVASNGTAYWTCKSAGVILKRTANGQVSVLLRGLNKPVGIALSRNGKTLYFTEVPTPGVSANMGGGNFVWEYSLRTGQRSIVHYGDPEPTDIAVAQDGTLYWTCTSAGVIIEARKM